MKLPQLAVANHAGPEPGHGEFYAHALLNDPSLPGVQMNGIFDSILGGLKDIVGGAVGKIPCILSKAGPQGIACFTKCGPNPACLAACAGPVVLNSIMECL